MSKRQKYKKPKELTDEQYAKVLEDLENFDSGFFSAIAGTDKYEVIPTLLEEGVWLTKEQYTLVKNECSRLGLTVVYQIQLNDKSSVFINPESLKIGYYQEGMH